MVFLDRLCVAGINFHKADTATRGLFAITEADYSTLAVKAKAMGLRSVFVVSTCNRTEIYGFAEHVSVLADLLVSESKGSKDEFFAYAYLKTGGQALEHLFHVASGLDSQILGDYEILGQLKAAVESAHRMDLIGPIMNRILSYVFQASKKIKTETVLSRGTVSVSYAAIELLKQRQDMGNKKMLVIGAGQFGTIICKNLKQYFPKNSISITNRTDERAQKLAEETGLYFSAYARLEAALAEADIIIVCSHAQAPIISSEHFRDARPKLVLDLSIPVNVHTEVRGLRHVEVTDVDQISTSILDKTLATRRQELPKALEIIEHYQTELSDWLQQYKYSLHIKSWKNKLQELGGPRISCCDIENAATVSANNWKVQKAMTRLAVNLRSNHHKGCQFINAINDYLTMS